jgi:hypothetical protein
MIKARLVLAAAAMLAAASVNAQSSRAGRSEFYLAPVFTDGKNYTFEGGSTARTDTGYGFTMGYGFNFDAHKSLGVEFGWGSQDYRATVQPGIGNINSPVNVNSYIETWTVRFLGTYNFSKNNFTPFVTGGLGWTYIDSNIPTGLPQNICWSYPWYGGYCGTYTPTATSTKFSYNAGAGLRYDSGRNVFRFMVNEQWVDFGGNYGSNAVTQYRIDLGWKF